MSKYSSSNPHVALAVCGSLEAAFTGQDMAPTGLGNRKGTYLARMMMRQLDH